MNNTYLCPACKSDNLEIHVLAWAFLIQEEDGNFETDTEVSDDADHEWDQDSEIICRDCTHHGLVSTFRAEPVQSTMAEPNPTDPIAALKAAESFIAEELDCRRRSYNDESNEYVSSASTALQSVRLALYPDLVELDKIVKDLQAMGLKASLEYPGHIDVDGWQFGIEEGQLLGNDEEGNSAELEDTTPCAESIKKFLEGPAS